MPTSNNPIFFDIESGGTYAKGRRASSILSISYEGSANFDEARKIITQYSKPVDRSWVSKFSEEKILSQLVDKKTVSEEQAIRAFIEELKQSDAPLAGYNIKSFDINFILERSKIYGLGEEFKSVLRNRKIVDVSYGVKDVISSAVTQHALEGNFDEMLGRPFTQMLTEVVDTRTTPKAREFNAIRQAAGYDFKRFRGAAAADVEMQGWKLEDVYEVLKKHNIVKEAEGMAHESATDVVMTRKLYELHQSGELAEAFKNKDVAASWVQRAAERRLVTEKEIESGFRSAGKYFEGIPSTRVKKIENIINTDAIGVGTKAAIGLIAGSAIIAAGFGIYNSFSGKDDEYNTEEGLAHGGEAEKMRRALTPFGSGWRGIEVDPTITEFARNTWSDPDERKRIRELIKENEERAQEALGEFEESDISEAEAVVKNAGAKKAQAVNLENFNVTAEDADTLILKRKGLLNFFSKQTQVRIAGIDAPEIGSHGNDPLDFIRYEQDQPFGQKASERLQQIIEGAKDLSLFITGEKTYGRYVGSLEADGESVSAKLLGEGMVTALPFGEVKEDLLNRKELEAIEEKAKKEEQGLWSLKRYKAIAAANEVMDKPLTYNTLTRLDKLAPGQALGAYASLLKSFGSETGDLNKAEIRQVQSVGRSISNYFGARSNKFSGTDDAHNTIEGLRHRGAAGELRRANTDFGSGFTKGLVKFVGKKSSKGSVLTDFEKMFQALGKSTKQSKAGFLDGLYDGFVSFFKGIVDPTLIPRFQDKLYPVTELKFDPVDVKNLYKHLSKEYHPDKAGGSAEAFIKLKEAYQKYQGISTIVTPGGTNKLYEAGLIATPLSMMAGSLAFPYVISRTIRSLSAKDDAHNTIEGLDHKGIAWQKRQSTTDFGSGWVDIMNSLQTASDMVTNPISIGSSLMLAALQVTKKIGESKLGKKISDIASNINIGRRSFLGSTVGAAGAVAGKVIASQSSALAGPASKAMSAVVSASANIPVTRRNLLKVQAGAQALSVLRPAATKAAGLLPAAAATGVALTEGGQEIVADIAKVAATKKMSRRSLFTLGSRTPSAKDSAHNIKAVKNDGLFSEISNATKEDINIQKHYKPSVQKQQSLVRTLEQGSSSSSYLGTANKSKNIKDPVKNYIDSEEGQLAAVQVSEGQTRKTSTRMPDKPTEPLQKQNSAELNLLSSEPSFSSRPEQTAYRNIKNRVRGFFSMDSSAAASAQRSTTKDMFVNGISAGKKANK